MNYNIKENNPQWTGIQNKLFCIDCGNKISKPTFLYGKKRCRICGALKRIEDNPDGIKGINHPMYGKKRIEWSKKFSGKNHWEYIDGRSYEKYPSEFNESLKEKIILRDSGLCQGKDCTMTREEHLLVYDRDIEVHHIDYNRNNCQDGNLITACKLCNLKANRNRDYWYAFYNYKLEERGIIK